MGLEADRPMGDTPAAHDELIPEDLPKGHPGRHAAEEQAAALGGSTPGHAEGGAAAIDGERSAPDADLVPEEETREGARFGRSEDARERPRGARR